MKSKSIGIFNVTLPIIILSLIVALTFSSCDNDDDVVPADPVAFVSLYHASPDAPDLDIMVDNRRINTYSFEYGQYTGYLRFYTGDRNLKFGPSGASNVVVDTTTTFNESTAYSVFVVDDYSNLDALILEDVYDTPTEGNAMIRFVHLSPDAPAVDLAIEGEAGVLVEDQEFKETPEFIEISADQYDFEVRNSQDSDDVLLSVPDITLQSGWYYSIIVRGYAIPPAGNSNVMTAHVIVN